MTNNQERIYRDDFGEVMIPIERKWGVQTQRSLENFRIGSEKIPLSLIYAYAMVKKAAAQTNAGLNKLSTEKSQKIKAICDEIIAGKWDKEFPLSVWQTGSGTQTNMNLNEVIANLVNEQSSENIVHPNDDVNMGQSTNDTFPTAMHISGVLQIERELLPVLNRMISILETLEEDYQDTVKLGRTHLQDATPITFGQEISGWKRMIQENLSMLELSLKPLIVLPLGGTAVGTGLNSHPEFGSMATEFISNWTGTSFQESDNKFHGLASKDAVVFAHGALNTLAVNAMKIANDIRWLASGPRGGMGEITIPANELGSSIMPGKINPTQAEALTMICTQVMGNHTTITVAGSQGNFELNAYMPVIAYNFLQSIELLADGLNQFTEKCLKGLEANEAKMLETVQQSLALVTALSPHIGYEKASEIAQKAEREGTTLKEAALSLRLINEADFDLYTDINKMI